VAATTRRAPRAGATVVPLDRRATGVDLGRLLPSGRALAVALGLLCAGIGGYFIARESSLFAVQSLEVRGAPPGVANRVRAALRPFVGTSLVVFDGEAVRRRLAALPVVAAASYDRDFPHTIRIEVRPELPLLVVRRGPEAWLVSVRARIMKELHGRAYPWLPRLWVGQSVELSPGSFLSRDQMLAVHVLRPLRGRPFSRQVRAVRAAPGNVTLVLRSGLKLRLGDLRDLRLKLAVGARVAAAVGPGSGYADLTVPGRPVVGQNSQVSG
jgi:POTRA domain, FtsQ-type